MTNCERGIADLETELEETYRSVTQLTNDLFQANELLRTNNRKLSDLYDTAHQFVDNVSHEFRTPLTVIREFASIMQDGLAGDVSDEQREYLGIIVNRADDLNLIVNDMLDISRLEAGLLGVSRKECRIGDIVEHIRTTLERRAAAGSVNLTIAIDDTLPTVYCDADKIRQVIINLVVNACKFSNEGGGVTLWAHDDLIHSQVVMGVTDKGSGIDPEHARAIFERFKQVGGNIRASTKGFGLGLNIAKELVQLNFGDIGVESELGKGSTFTFTIPTFDPPEILKRLLKCIEHFRNGSSYVSLIAARIDPEADSALENDVEKFLHGQLRRSDLLFGKLPGRWLLCAAANRKGLDQMMARFAEARIEFNRYRPGDALPEIDYKNIGTWRVLDQGRDFIKQFKAEFGAGRSINGELLAAVQDMRGHGT